MLHDFLLSDVSNDVRIQSSADFRVLKRKDGGGSPTKSEHSGSHCGSDDTEGSLSQQPSPCADSDFTSLKDVQDTIVTVNNLYINVEV